MAQSIPTNHSRALNARALRLDQSVVDLTRYSGWQSVAEQELEEARTRHADKFLGGEELLTLIDSDAVVAADARKAAKGAI